MKKLLKENLIRQYQKIDKSKEKIKNTTFSEKMDKESTHVSSVRNSSKCKNTNIANKSIEFITQKTWLITVAKLT
jgi:hypothetical protein